LLESRKNVQLQKQRDISFEKILVALNRGEILDNICPPDQARYPNQRILIIKINNYAFLVPYIESENEIFLKTIIPSRKATKKYLFGDS
jgi:hypothetical protein